MQKFTIPASHPPTELRKIACLTAAAFEGDIVNSSVTPAATSLLSGILTNAAELWSSSSFAQMASSAQQRALCRLLQHCLRLWITPPVRDAKLNSLDANSVASYLFPVACTTSATSSSLIYPFLSNHPSISGLMAGVQLRLASSIFKVRLHAMRVAEAFSRVLSPSMDAEETLEFEELRQVEDSAVESEHDIASRACEDCFLKSRTSLLGLYKLEAGSACGAESAVLEDTLAESDDDLQAFDIKSELTKPKRTVPLPKSLRSMLNCASKHDDGHHLEAALEIAHLLISQHFPDLPEVRSVNTFILLLLHLPAFAFLLFIMSKVYTYAYFLDLKQLASEILRVLINLV
jgi:hypothetical protein